MSYASAKGYRAEHAIEELLHSWGHACTRPRAGCHDDVGDIAGVPLVVSVKAHARMDLGHFTSGLVRMVEAAKLDTGVVWHKKVGKGSPLDWYVTTTGSLFRPLFEAYCEVHR